MFISEQLITMHLKTCSPNIESDVQVVENIDIFTMEGWAKKVASEDMSAFHIPDFNLGEIKI